MKNWLGIFLGGSLMFSSLVFGGWENVEVQQDGKVINFRNKEDVVSYVGYQNDASYMCQLKERYRGLADYVDILLAKENYIQVLDHLWTEEDAVKRLAWLEEKVKEGHAILMFELGLEYLKQDPSFETYAKKTFPWIMAGTGRTVLDVLCSSDKSVEAAVEFLKMSYQMMAYGILNVDYWKENALDAYLAEHKEERMKTTFSHAMDVLSLFLDDSIEKMPSPAWVFNHGMGAFFDDEDDEDEEVIPPSKWNEIRRKQAQSDMKKIKGFLEENE